MTPRPTDPPNPPAWWRGGVPIDLDAAAVPTIAAIEATRRAIDPYVDTTPVHRLDPQAWTMAGDRWSSPPETWVKLEFLQRTGTFKARGAVNRALTLSDEERRHGVTAVSAGNHAIAVAYAARAVGTTAKVVMPSTADPVRVARCEAYGAEVVRVEGIDGAFAEVQRIVHEEGRTFLHPFEGPRTVEGTATVGMEIAAQVEGADAVVVAVGGGGLIAGVGSAMRRFAPTCQVIGVEPTGACGMTRSLVQGRALERVEVSTIADSMGPPMHTEGTFSVCQQVVDAVVTVDDDELRSAMAFAFDAMRLALEPAGVAAFAAVRGPLRSWAEGKKIVVLACGSNVSHARWCDAVASAEAARQASVGARTTSL